MEEIARIAGYASTSAMRHQFQKQYSLSPVRYRKVFSSRLKP
ncbi:AraC family transcriptional regulator [Paraburkholderia sp. Ac-20342]|nr:AraC family transcriptional regulator [Paraburkholderia sp. Ac-20342]